MLPLLRLGQVKLVSCSIGCRECKENVAMLAGLWRRSRCLVLDYVFQMVLRRRGRRFSGAHRDPMAKLGPLGVVSGWCIWVGENDHVWRAFLK